MLVGHFTVDGRQQRAAEEDRYDIASVEKVGEDRWRFNVRMRHGSFDVTMPVVVPVKWVDDTPMVTLTDWEIPTLGTFTCRVVFYGDRYAGTWQHGKFGGLMYGRIEETGRAVAGHPTAALLAYGKKMLVAADVDPSVGDRGRRVDRLVHRVRAHDLVRRAGLQHERVAFLARHRHQAAERDR